jgi:hypothetical protein
VSTIRKHSGPFRYRLLSSLFQGTVPTLSIDLWHCVVFWFPDNGSKVEKLSGSSTSMLLPVRSLALQLTNSAAKHRRRRRRQQY